MIKPRIITLSGGPHHGQQTMASARTAIHGSALYVQDGGPDPDTFRPALDVLAEIPPENMAILRPFVIEPTDAVLLSGVMEHIPMWQMNCVVELHRYGQLPPVP